VLLTDMVRIAGLHRALSAALARWRKPTDDPAKIICDVALALGGDCLSDVAVLRTEPGLFGLVASEAPVSRTIDLLAADAGGGRAVVWRPPGDQPQPSHPPRPPHR
jgi:hypothetical protein